MFRLIGLLSAAATIRDRDVIESIPPTLSGEACDALGKAVLAFIPDGKAAAWFMNHWEWSYYREPYPWKSIAAAPKPRVDHRKSEMCKLAFRLLYQGISARALAGHVRAANSQYVDPLPDNEIDRLILWCATTHLSKDTTAAPAPARQPAPAHKSVSGHQIAR